MAGKSPSNHEITGYIGEREEVKYKERKAKKDEYNEMYGLFEIQLKKEVVIRE